MARIAAPIVETAPIQKEVPRPAPTRETGYLKTKEIGTSAKERDVGLLALGIVAQKGNDILKGKVATPESLQAIAETNPAEGEIAFFSYLFRSDIKPTGIGGQPITVEIGDQKVDITQIDGREGNVFKCKSGKEDVEVGVESFVTAQLESAFSSPEVRELFENNPNQLKVIDAYLKGLKGETKDANAIEDSILKDLALESGAIPVEVSKKWAEANKPTLSPEKVAELETALKELEGRTVTSPEDLSAISQIIIPENVNSTLTELAVSIKTKSAELEAVRGKIPPDEQAKLEIELLQLTQLQTVTTNVQDFFKASPQIIENFSGQVQRGEVGVETVRRFNVGLESNNPQIILEALQSEKNLPEAAVAEIKKAIDYMKIGKIGGGISFGFFLMMLWKAISGEGLLGAVGK